MTGNDERCRSMKMRKSDFVIYEPPTDGLPFIAAHIVDGRARVLSAMTRLDAEGAIRRLEYDAFIRGVFEGCDGT
jgi:hypothetical protein